MDLQREGSFKWRPRLAPTSLGGGGERHKKE
jgi:hypothetical protein